VGEVKRKEYLRSLFRLCVLFPTLWHFAELKMVDYENRVKNYEFGYLNNKTMLERPFPMLEYVNLKMHTLYHGLFVAKIQKLRKKCSVWRMCAWFFSKACILNIFANKYSYLGSFSRVSCRIACRFSRKVVVKIIESKENLSAVCILYKTNVMNVYSMALGFTSCVKTDKIIWIDPRSLLDTLQVA
jgi:hypothetical protein